MKKFKDPRFLVRLAAIIILVVVVLIYVIRFFSGYAVHVANNELKDIYYSSEAEEQEEPAAETEIQEQPAEEAEDLLELEAEAEDAGPVIQEDFLELYEINNNLIGWLTAGESIDYPVVQGDNDYWLYHNFNDKRDANGSVFMNSCSTLFPRDDVLLIHGHNMASGAMFGRLKRFVKYDYLCQYPVVMFRTIYDPENVYYTPVAAFNAAMYEDYPNYFNVERILFEDDEDSTEEARSSKTYDQFLKEIIARSDWKPLTDVNVNDKLIVLITCSNDREDGDKRMLLYCRQLREDETPEMIQELYGQTEK